MAWTTPATWSVGEVPTSSKMNTQIKDNLDALDQHAHTGAAGDGAAIPDFLSQQAFASR